MVGLAEASELLGDGRVGGDIVVTIRDLMRELAPTELLVPVKVADGAGAHCWFLVVELNRRPTAGAVLTAAKLVRVPLLGLVDEF